MCRLYWDRAHPFKQLHGSVHNSSKRIGGISPTGVHTESSGEQGWQSIVGSWETGTQVEGQQLAPKVSIAGELHPSRLRPHLSC